MAYFAKIENGFVTQVIALNDDCCGGGDFPESEPIGQAFIASVSLDGEWLQTSLRNEFRAKYAGIGDTYDPIVDEFVSPPTDFGIDLNP